MRTNHCAATRDSFYLKRAFTQAFDRHFPSQENSVYPPQMAESAKVRVRVQSREYEAGLSDRFDRNAAPKAYWQVTAQVRCSANHVTMSRHMLADVCLARENKRSRLKARLS